MITLHGARTKWFKSERASHRQIAVGGPVFGGPAVGGSSYRRSTEYIAFGGPAVGGSSYRTISEYRASCRRASCRTELL